MARSYTHVLSFRITAAEHRSLQRLRATFPEAQWGETFRWLLQDPTVVDVINERLEKESPASDRGSWGLDMSLPVGDR